MALFIVLVLILVLTVVISQLTFTTKIEERISRNRQGFLELSQTLIAVARSAIQALETDLMEDLGFVTGDELEGEEKEDAATPSLPGLDGDSGQDPSRGTSAERFDTRHEEWASKVEEELNGYHVEMWKLDGEGRLNLNHLFEYAQHPEDDDGTNPDLGSEGDGPPFGSPPGAADDGTDDPSASGEEDEWVAPTPEQIEDAETILSRLIQSVIASNEEGGFEYQELPDPDLAAREIVEWVVARQTEPETRLIRSIDELLRVDGVSWELLNEPRPFDEEGDRGDRRGGGSLGGRGSDFNDDPLSQFADELGGTQPGYEDLDDGVQEIPRPLGLRDVLTTHSSGEINLNTARREVITALILGIEDLEEAREIALQIDEYLNLFVVPEEDGELIGEEIADEETQEFNHFKAVDDLGKVNEDWADGTLGDSILDILRADLGPVSTFKSTYFTVRLKGTRAEQPEGTRNDRILWGTMEIVREEQDIIVLSWEESDG